MREQTIATIQQEKIIAILRGVDQCEALQVADALYAGGIRLLEVTFQQNAPETFLATAEAIATVSERYRGRMLVGAGTVISPGQAEQAYDAGAAYIISPNMDPEIIKRTRELNMVSIPGAMTPTEILAANNAGADFVKVFPAAALGAAYIKAVRAPISHVKLMAVGGINSKNAPEFLSAGICGLGVGGNLVDQKSIAAGEFENLKAAAEELVAAVRNHTK